MTQLYDEAIRRLQKLEVMYGEDELGITILPILKVRRANLRKFLEG